MHDRRTSDQRVDIAIVGIGCRMPGANGPTAFWNLLVQGTDAIGTMPPERAELAGWPAAEANNANDALLRNGGFINDVADFDAEFFRITPIEAINVDPQHRLLLEVAWSAFEDAMITPDEWAGQRVGVFVGIGNSDYSRMLADPEHCGAHTAIGGAYAIAANRLSYFFDFRGPSLAIDTACSSSLIAVHEARASLLRGESEMALVAGVNLILAPAVSKALLEARMLAADGRCKTFDASANGYVRGEGVGVVLLKKLADAQRDGDRIYAVIKGSAANQDGLTNGLTAPNGISQQAVIRAALDAAGMTPRDISLLEAHGTGTALGDQIEVGAIKAVRVEHDLADRPCWLGSLKTNIGHLEAAAGIAGLIKTALCLHHEAVPPHLHLHRLNPYINLASANLRIASRLEPWQGPGRHAGVSSFGFGGSNCHVVLGSAPVTDNPDPEPDNTSRLTSDHSRPTGTDLLPISAQSEAALDTLAREYMQRYTKDHQPAPECDWSGAVHTAQTGRSHLPFRMAVLAGANHGVEAGSTPMIVVQGRPTRRQRPRVGFLFTGQGSQYVGMGHTLYAREPVFRDTVNECELLFQASGGQGSLCSVLYSTDPDDATIHQTAWTQPALFACEIALHRLWTSWGVQPAALLGHSVGEYAAACAAGVFSLADGMKLIVQRGRLMQALPDGGTMAAIGVDQATVEAALGPYRHAVAIAACNGPRATVVSGDGACVDALCADLRNGGATVQLLRVSHAFHSPLMTPMLDAFRAVAESVSFSAPSLPLISNLSGALADRTIANADYWCRHVLEPVRFADGFKTMLRLECTSFVEIGPAPVLLGLGRAVLESEAPAAGEGTLWHPSLRPAADAHQTIMTSLAHLYVNGTRIDWRALQRHRPGRRVSLPGYPFQRQRYWLKTAARPASAMHMPADDPEHRPDGIGVFEPTWHPVPRTSGTTSGSTPSGSGSWLILADCSGIGTALASQLTQAGQRVHIALRGASLRDALDQACAEPTAPLTGIVHLWGLESHIAPYQHSAAALDGDYRALIEPLLELAQHLSGVGAATSAIRALLPASCKLWLLTQAAQPVNGSRIDPHAILQAALWGAGLTMVNEMPNRVGALIDLPQHVTTDIVHQVVQQLLAPDAEIQLAWRAGQRWAARATPVSLPPLESLSGSARPDGSYLITGGTGALGMKVADWLARQGARHIALLARSAPGAQTLAEIEALRARDVEVRVLHADVARPESLRAALDEIAAAMPPLRGIVHAASVLDDGLLMHQTSDRFACVAGPKIGGAWNLHHQTLTLPIELFILFSSAATPFGSPGQANYTAANAVLDSLAHARRALGLPALSIAWGPWADIGMAARTRATTGRSALGTLKAVDALNTLQRLLATSLVDPVVLELPQDTTHWRHGNAPLAQRLRASLPEILNNSPSTASADDARARYVNLAVADRPAFLLDLLQRSLAEITGLSPAQIQADARLMHIGLDSLMVLELRNRIMSMLGIEIPIDVLMAEATLNTVVEHLVARLDIFALAATHADTGKLESGEFEEFVL